MSTDLLVRRELTLNPATLTSHLALKVAIDNDVDVFFNGVLIASNDFEGCGQEKATFAIPRSLVPDGANILAVRAIDRGGINYLDLDLWIEGGADPEEPPTTPHDPIANAGEDQTVTEGTVVTLDGSGSQASLKPVLSASSKNASLPGLHDRRHVEPSPAMGGSMVRTPRVDSAAPRGRDGDAPRRQANSRTSSTTAAGSST